MNAKPGNKLKEGAVPTIFSTVKKPLERLSSENRITTQAKNHVKLTKFLVTIFGLTNINKLQSTDTLVKCDTISNVTKWLDWIIWY